MRGFRIKVLIATSLLLLTSMSSCSLIFSKMYGLKKIMHLSENEIFKVGEKYHIPDSLIYELNPRFADYLNGLDTNYLNKNQKNHFQPLQVLYFNEEGALISYHVNCFTGGFPNLNWNRFEAFDTFPARQQAPLDTILNFEKQVEFLCLLDDNKIEKNQKEYAVFVYWASFMGRQSKRLIKLVKESMESKQNKKVKIYFVNTDNFFFNLEN